MNKKRPNKHDKCVVCHEITEYAEMDHILVRDFYIEGVGQLCQGCFDNASKEDQMVRYEESLKETDWGHQPS